MTAKEYIEKNNQGSFGLTQEALMIEFAKMHVTEALKQASESVDCELTHYYSSERNAFDKVEESILTAYPLENIK